MGDRVILMQHGRIVQDGTPDELYNRPASAFAASFIGSPAMNLLPLEAGEQGAVIEGETSVSVAPLEAAGGQLGIRPEDIELRPAAAAGVPARVLSDEYLGADTIAHLAVGQHTLRVRLSGKHAIAGQQCRLSWPTAAAHLFGEDGLRRDDLSAYSLTPTAAIPTENSPPPGSSQAAFIAPKLHPKLHPQR